MSDFDFESDSPLREPKPHKRRPYKRGTASVSKGVIAAVFLTILIFFMPCPLALTLPLSFALLVWWGFYTRRGMKDGDTGDV
jgi:hypothetical protein